MLAAALLSSGNAAGAQIVPEGIHSFAEGPSDLCGVVGNDALDIISRLRASSDHRQVALDSDRFELFVGPDDLDQWVVTRATEPAHPAVTCRDISQDAAGNWVQSREMRCDSTREACDRLFLEFQELDERLARELGGR